MHCQVLDINSIEWREILTLIEHDIYQLPEYVALEAKRTNTIPKAFLAVDGDKIFFVTYLIRSCQDIIEQYQSEDLLGEQNFNLEENIFDVISPYGYPGILLSNVAKKDSDFCTIALEKFRHCLQKQNICSGFFRLHPILNQGFQNIFAADTFFANGTTISVDITQSTEEILKDTKPNHRNKINRSVKRDKLTTKIIKLSQEIDIFCQLYEETMTRVGAKNIYYSFNSEYFYQMNKTLGDYLYLCLVISSSGEVASAGLYTECSGIVQAAFGGISNDYVQQSPSVLEIDAMRWWAKEKGYKYLHLGGGVGGSEDSVYKFKAGFSKLKHDFHTLRLITDQDKYNYLVNIKAKSYNISLEELKKSNFFPAYRSPLTTNSKP